MSFHAECANKYFMCSLKHLENRCDFILYLHNVSGNPLNLFFYSLYFFHFEIPSVVFTLFPNSIVLYSSFEIILYFVMLIVISFELKAEKKRAEKS